MLQACTAKWPSSFSGKNVAAITRPLQNNEGLLARVGGGKPPIIYRLFLYNDGAPTVASSSGRRNLRRG